MRQVVDGEAGTGDDQHVGPGHHGQRGGAEAKSSAHVARVEPRSSRRSAGVAIAPDRRTRRTRCARTVAVHRRAVVPAAGELGEPHRPEQLADHQPAPPTAVSSSTSRIGPSVTDSRTAPVTVAGSARAPGGQRRARRCPRAAAGPR